MDCNRSMIKADDYYQSNFITQHLPFNTSHNDRNNILIIDILTLIDNHHSP